MVDLRKQEVAMNFDPLTKNQRDLREVPLAAIELANFTPNYINLHGNGQTVTSWPRAFDFALVKATRILQSPHMIGDLIGLDVRGGPNHEGYRYIPDIDVSVKNNSRQVYAAKIQSLITDMCLPVSLRAFSLGKGGEKNYCIIKNSPHPDDVPQFGSYIPRQRGKAPGLDKKTRRVKVGEQFSNQMNERLSRNEIMVGSWVSLDIEGITSPEKYMKIVPENGNPLRGTLGVNSPVGKAILGHRIGDEVEYTQGPRSRIIRIADIDNHKLKEAHARQAMHQGRGQIRYGAGAAQMSSFGI